MKKNDKLLLVRLPTFLFNDFDNFCKFYNISKSFYVRKLIASEVVKNGENVKSSIYDKL